jgi:hypothetical protein
MHLNCDLQSPWIQQLSMVVSSKNFLEKTLNIIPFVYLMAKEKLLFFAFTHTQDPFFFNTSLH